MELFPAVLIGGPPHSGKSVLAYSLTQVLREAKIEHYVLRAYPDGEGDWANEASQRMVRHIRVKGEGSPEWVAQICGDIANRQLPLLVDVGGRPTAWQEEIFAHCTHAILLTPDETSQETWETYARQYSLTIIANLRSVLHGEQTVQDKIPVLRGVISGLERGELASGPTFEALVARLKPLVAYPAEELLQIQLRLAPVETTLVLEPLLATLGGASTWQPAHIPLLLDYVPAETPLAVYGRAPNWVYTALALHTQPADFYQFDPRLGWVQPPVLRVEPSLNPSPLQFKIQTGPDYTQLGVWLTAAYLDYGQAQGLGCPPVSDEQGLILDGKLPHWLITALALCYTTAPWLAVYQPQVGGAVVTHSTVTNHPVGQLIPLTGMKKET